MQFLSNTLARRCEKDVQDMRSILKELQASIEIELHEPGWEQLNLWTSAEKEQLQRNVDSLRNRLTAIPDEVVHETEAIRRRYASPQPRLFPVAITFLVPEAMA